jgi:transposase
MARDGRSRSQIAVSLGVGRSTIVAWTAGITAESLSRVVV